MKISIKTILFSDLLTQAGRSIERNMRRFNGTLVLITRRSMRYKKPDFWGGSKTKFPHARRRNGLRQALTVQRIGRNTFYFGVKGHGTLARRISEGGVRVIGRKYYSYKSYPYLQAGMKETDKRFKWR